MYDCCDTLYNSHFFVVVCYHLEEYNYRQFLCTMECTMRIIFCYIMYITLHNLEIFLRKFRCIFYDPFIIMICPLCYHITDHCCVHICSNKYENHTIVFNRMRFFESKFFLSYYVSLNNEDNKFILI